MSETAETSPRPLRDPLKIAAMVFGVGWLLHNLDHLRRGLDVITTQVFSGGVVIGVAAVVTLALVFTGHRLAAPAAVTVGFATAVAVSGAHLLPDWGTFSDALPGGSVDAFTWAAVLLEIGGALLLGVVGLVVQRHPAAAST